MYHPEEKNLWFFGGYDSAKIYNDLWKWDHDNGWEEIHPFSDYNRPGYYIEMDFNNINYPGSRFSPGYCIGYGSDGRDSLWLFGGYGYGDENSGK